VNEYAVLAIAVLLAVGGLGWLGAFLHMRAGRRKP
jgi:hypothetical protein